MSTLLESGEMKWQKNLKKRRALSGWGEIKKHGETLNFGWVSG
jgi:hypothetical protein